MNRDVQPTNRRGIYLTEILLVTLFCFVYAGGRPPDVNEAHYMTKAKHFWNPEWCEGDFFLDSADAHVAFYWTVGTLTKWFELAAATWIARLAGWLSVAIAGTLLFRRCVSHPGGAALATCAVTLLWGHGHMAGEWVVGGCEAKVFAYAFVFGALSCALANRWNLALALIGAATAFHVLIGGWSGVALAVCWGIQPPDQRPGLSQLSLGIVVMVLLAVFGVLPAIALSWGVNSDQSRLANEIYVFGRLPHHLVLHRMRWINIVRFVALVVVWLWGSSVTQWRPGERLLRNFVHMTLVLAAGGVLADAMSLVDPDLAAKLLRYYWFRLADVFVPLGLVWIGGKWLTDIWQQRPATAGRCLASLLVVAIVLMGSRWTQRRQDVRPVADFQGQPVWSADRETQIRIWHAWRDVCGWARERTKRHAQFLTPIRNQTFTWYAERPEFVCWKNIPQDAAGIVEWQRRVDQVHQSGLYRGDASYSPVAVIDLVKQHDLDYIIATPTVQTVPCEFPVAYENSYFRVYDVSTTRFGKKR